MSYPELLSPEEKLADGKKALGIHDVVVLCGSMRFAEEMSEVAIEESVLRGSLVLKPDCNMKLAHRLWSDPVKAEALKLRLDSQHRQKIRLADRVIVVGDYVGDSTRAEIAYARELGKPVRFTHPEVDTGELTASELAQCGKCRQPFDPTDARFDGRAQHKLTPFCRSCVDRCHDTEIADHRCVICA
jgi:hypothetical protein